MQSIMGCILLESSPTAQKIILANSKRLQDSAISMSTIYKFLVRPGATEIVIPKGSEVLCVQMQNGQPHIWVKIAEDTERETIRITCYGTGWDLPGEIGKYIGTFQTGALVFHAFETRP